MKPVLNINIEYISNKCEVRSEEIKPVLNINIEFISTNFLSTEYRHGTRSKYQY